MSDVITLDQPTSLKPETTSEERLWAAFAHLSTILTLMVSLGSAGLGGLPFVFVPFLIYLAYRDKSEYVANQAAQAFAIQIAGSVGYFVAILAVVVILTLFWVITGVLSIILIGLILIPVAVLLSVAGGLAIVAYPFALGVFSIIATVQVSNGEDYQAPYIGVYVQNWMDEYQEEKVTPSAV